MKRRVAQFPPGPSFAGWGAWMNMWRCYLLPHVNHHNGKWVRPDALRGIHRYEKLRALIKERYERIGW